MRFIIAIDASPQGGMGVHRVPHLRLSPRDEALLVSVVHAPVMAGRETTSPDWSQQSM